MGEELTSLLGLGGPVVVILLALSILALSVIIYKIWDLQRSGVGRHGEIRRAIAAGSMTAAHRTRGIFCDPAGTTLRRFSRTRSKYGTLKRLG
jgi:hypothetical protein